VENSATFSSNLVQASMVLVFVFFLSDIECLGVNEFVKCTVFMFCSGSIRGVLLFLFYGVQLLLFRGTRLFWFWLG